MGVHHNPRGPFGINILLAKGLFAVVFFMCVCVCVFQLGVCQNSQNLFSLLDNFSWIFQNLNLRLVQTFRVKYFAGIKSWDWHTKIVFLLVSAVSLVLNFPAVSSKRTFELIIIVNFYSKQQHESWFMIGLFFKRES